MDRLKQLITEYYELGIPEQIDYEKFYLFWRRKVQSNYIEKCKVIVLKSAH